MNLLLDMNLPIQWVDFLGAEGIHAVHWSTVGDPRAKDAELMDWARANNYVVFTHDLDFGILLARTRADGPSVIQARTSDVTPTAIGRVVLNVLRQLANDLESGALVTVAEHAARVRVLPIRRSE